MSKIQTQCYGAILLLRFTSVEFVLRTAELMYAVGKCVYIYIYIYKWNYLYPTYLIGKPMLKLIS